MIDSTCEYKKVVDNEEKEKAIEGLQDSTNKPTDKPAVVTTGGEVKVTQVENSDGDDDSSNSTIGFMIIPGIIVILASIITTVVLIMKGNCCSCCYLNFKGL